jgi:hypothetical protein
MITETKPVLTSTTIVAIVTAVIALLVAFGFELTNEQTAAILGLFGVLAPIAVGIYSSRKTTPLVKPEDEDGTPLVRSDTGAPTIEQTRSMKRG